jgi:hypothetical protein
MSGRVQPVTLIPKDMPGPIPVDLFTLLAEVKDALPTLPAVLTEMPEIRSIGTAVKAGPSGARGVLEVAGGAAVASALMKGSASFRSTGHFHRSNLLERLAFVVAGWERRARPRGKR